LTRCLHAAVIRIIKSKRIVHISKQKNRGFTLVEIMIVVIIIGVLAVMAYPAFLKVKTHALASRIANDFRSFSGLFEVYLIVSKNLDVMKNKAQFASKRGSVVFYVTKRVAGWNAVLRAC